MDENCGCDACPDRDLYKSACIILPGFLCVAVAVDQPASLRHFGAGRRALSFAIPRRQEGGRTSVAFGTDPGMKEPPSVTSTKGGRFKECPLDKWDVTALPFLWPLYSFSNLMNQDKGTSNQGITKQCL